MTKNVMRGVEWSEEIIQILLPFGGGGGGGGGRGKESVPYMSSWLVMVS